ncbi:uncharacterized protein AMSG_03970 [Thecamonas trahens ATCC 50062]|uniref:ATP-dependent RNA helicase n=1 Tax=Thecamonas trahens ATCC 50062 TaxID=461836 RepID=A0A0L0D8X4_THETB|nr:hypothetical protein AMSG_03970 [Thecamonas trahens ATCC 50062]KNC47743.1 hypothetical protein AMSG_03970 [Thecamonas trahens ATCC 50062]|eukprot:XP_013759221.1 hypothetical protein AMSG_03970 [Thecamonas trahens ATCC 50062]
MLGLGLSAAWASAIETFLVRSLPAASAIAPSPLQAALIPYLSRTLDPVRAGRGEPSPARGGRNGPAAVLAADTIGSGKTIAYLAPLLSSGADAVVVTPTTLLADQVTGVVDGIIAELPPAAGGRTAAPGSRLRIMPVADLPQALVGSSAPLDALVLDEVDALIQPPSRYAARQPPQAQPKHTSHDLLSPADLRASIRSIDPEHGVLVAVSASINAPLRHMLRDPRLGLRRPFLRLGSQPGASPLPPSIAITSLPVADRDAKLDAVVSLLSACPGASTLVVVDSDSRIESAMAALTRAGLYPTQLLDLGSLLHPSDVPPALIVSDAPSLRGLDLSHLEHVVIASRRLPRPLANFAHIAGRVGRASQAASATRVTVAVTPGESVILDGMLRQHRRALSTAQSATPGAGSASSPHPRPRREADPAPVFQHPS